ncbi:MAG: endonuclease domain-containing protein [Frankiaceae bacterium]
MIRSRCRGRPGAGHAGRVLALSDPQSGSLIESYLRVRLHEEGVPAPVTQYPVLDHAGGLILVADFAWPPLRLVVETDGHAYHSGRRRQLVDRYRANALLRAGWHLMRFGYEDAMGRGRHCARTALATLRELASGELWQPRAHTLCTDSPKTAGRMWWG